MLLFKKNAALISMRLPNVSFGGLSDLSQRYVILADALPSFGTYNCKGRPIAMDALEAGFRRTDASRGSGTARVSPPNGGQWTGIATVANAVANLLSTFKQEVPLTRVKTAFPCSLYHLRGTAESDRPPGRGGDFGLPQVPLHGRGGSAARLFSAGRFYRVVYRVTRPGGTAPGRSAGASTRPARSRPAGPPGTRQRGRFRGFAGRGSGGGGRRIRGCALDCERT